MAGDHIRDSQAYRIIRAMSWGTSLLAVLVGVLGVMNTMMMTVFERTQEICVLLAIGWKRSRIMRMILWESALLGFLGGVCGVLLGVAGVKVLVTAPAMRGLLEPDLNPKLLVTAVAIAVVVGVVSGVYPACAVRGSCPARLCTVDVLRGAQKRIPSYESFPPVPRHPLLPHRLRGGSRSGRRDLASRLSARAAGWRFLCPPAHGDQRAESGDAAIADQATADEGFLRGAVSGALSEGTQRRIRVAQKERRSRQRLHLHAAPAPCARSTI